MTSLYVSADDEETRLGLEAAIGEQMADLSTALETPEGVKACDAFQSQDVTFASAGWMSRLAEVQGWLYLGEDLSEDSPGAFLASLARGLETTPEKIAHQGRLTLNGLEILQQRLDTAKSNQQLFMERLESEANVRSATQGWVEAWEDAAPDIDSDSGIINAKAGTWNIREFVDRAKQAKLNLSPSYQRDDVWPTSDARLLIESILRGIPLPSVILLKPSGKNSHFEVVDGKQRLTAILRFVGAHPVAIAEITDRAPQLLSLFREDYPKFRTAWKNATGDQLTETLERKYYFPFKLRSGEDALKGDLAPLRGRYYSEVRDHTLPGGIQVSDLFEMSTDYKVPIIEYDQATPRQVHEVFSLYNKQGKHLNAEEIRNALYHRLHIMRGLLVAAGDSPDIEGVAPFLKAGWSHLSVIPAILRSYQFGETRYRRTKVLSWVSSVIFFDSRDPDDKASLRSTASHMNEWLSSLEKPGHTITSESGAAQAIELLYQGLVAHSGSPEAWAPRFMTTSSSSTRWQELPLVGSLIGVTLAAAVLGDETADVVLDHAEALEELTGELKRMTKTQTRDQWKYIARIAEVVIHELGVTLDEADDALLTQFGTSGVPVLKHALTV